jgi:hypothetical protein
VKLTGNRCRCSACGERFNSAKTFDGHRVGPFSPITRPTQRRCLSVEQMQAKGWLLNDAGFWISGKRPTVARASRAGAAIALAGYWLLPSVIEATAHVRSASQRRPAPCPDSSIPNHQEL